MMNPMLHAWWAYTLRDFAFFDDLGRTESLLALHTLLDGIERSILEALARRHGDQALAVWERARRADDDEIEDCAGRELCGNYVRLAQVVCRAEQREIEALQAQRRSA